MGCALAMNHTSRVITLPGFIAIMAALAGFCILMGALHAQDRPSTVPQPAPITEDDMIYRIGKSQLLIEAQDRYITVLQRRIVELQTELDRLKKKEP